MWFRALLITVLAYLLMRSVVRILHPQDAQRQVKGRPASKSRRFDESRIKDATFKDIHEE